MVSYWPERWPVPALANLLVTMGTPFYSASYQNDPAALGGNLLATDWLHPYLLQELIDARAAAGVTRGAIYGGIDPAHGGQGTDPDFMGLFAVEVIENRGFALAYTQQRLKVEEQAQYAEYWFDRFEPNLIFLEETSSRGFMYGAMTEQINNGKGSKWPITVRKPQGSGVGNKEYRLVGMAARFESGQVRIPGVMHGGNVVLAPDWSEFIEQWEAFPTSHDDILDACYWALFEAFTAVVAGAVTLPPGTVLRDAGLAPRQVVDERAVVRRTSTVKEARRIGEPRQRMRIRW